MPLMIEYTRDSYTRMEFRREFYGTRHYVDVIDTLDKWLPRKEDIPGWLVHSYRRSIELGRQPLLAKPRDAIAWNIQRVLNKIVLGPAWPWPYAVFATPYEFMVGYPRLHVEMRLSVLHRESGDLTQVCINDQVPFPLPALEQDMEGLIIDWYTRDFLHKAVMHELHESIYFEGKLLRDPHPT